jgi:diguanylate cyclase (GGDEF)-like protein
MTDILTRLPNRRLAMARLDDEVNKARQSETELCAIMIDIDHFKSVNDEHGHDLGDLVLKETAGIIRQSTRKGDVTCRLGGEEFLVICPGSSLEGARAIAERIRTAVEQHEIPPPLGRPVTVSLGVARFQHSSSTVDSLLKEADRNVYCAKRLGRNQVSCGDEALDRRQSA